MLSLGGSSRCWRTNAFLQSLRIFMVYQRQGGKIYFQSLMVIDVDKVPEGYTLRQFPASDFLVITYEWLPTNEEAIQHGIGAGWEHIKTILRYDEPGSPITVIEKENADTPGGSRYEFWMPIRKIHGFPSLKDI